MCLAVRNMKNIIKKHEEYIRKQKKYTVLHTMIYGIVPTFTASLFSARNSTNLFSETFLLKWQWQFSLIFYIFLDRTPVYLSSIEDKVEIMQSLQLPKKITLRGSDGKCYIMMCKPKVSNPHNATRAVLCSFSFFYLLCLIHIHFT